MGNFNRDRDNRSDRGGDFRRGGFGGRSFDRPAMQMYPATCDSCGKSCEVPFKPTNGKPVYCRDCFRNQGGSSDSRTSGGRNFERPNFEEKKTFSSSQPQYNEQFQALNAKLDQILKLLTPDTSTQVIDQAALEAVVTSEPDKKPRVRSKKAKLSA